MIHLTQKAIKAVQAAILKEDSKKPYLCLGLVGGGIGRYEYLLRLDSQYDESLDYISHIDGLVVAIDKQAVPFVRELTIDFDDDEEEFKFYNPNASAVCSCGLSFDV